MQHTGRAYAGAYRPAAPLNGLLAVHADDGQLHPTGEPGQAELLSAFVSTSSHQLPLAERFGLASAVLLAAE